MIYVKKISLPSERSETEFIKNENRTCFNSFYPFKIFSEKELYNVEFDGITMFYGGNGSGKSTLINILAEKMNATRYSDFNDSPFFQEYVDRCFIEYTRMPKRSYVLTSDDVFDSVLSARSLNESIDERRNALFEKYMETHRMAELDPKIVELKGFDDFERWKETHEILSRRKTQSGYIKKRVARDIELSSNGETAMRYFLDRIDEDAVYFLDEPENSLSVQFQIQLAEYIEATARATRSQFIIATHSPIFLSVNNARIYDLDAYPVSVCRWTDLPNVRRYFNFFMEHKSEFI